MQHRISTPLTDKTISKLRCGDTVLISGTIYTARDAAHKRITEAIAQGKTLPFDLKGQIVYYTGPTPAKPGRVLGSAGPTTSGRMDAYAPTLMEHGLKGMIGKGNRNDEVKKSIKENCCVYFAAIGGAGALLSHCIVKSDVIAYDDLGTEAIRKLEVKDFPVFVAVDCEGRDIYQRESLPDE